MTAAANTAAEQSAAPQSPPMLAPADYLGQTMADQPVICGRQMLPLSIGRYRLMEKYNVAFISPTPTVADAGDLMMGVFICSHTCADLKAVISGKSFPRQLDKWARKHGFLLPSMLEWPIVGRWIAKIFGPALREISAARMLNGIEDFQRYIANAATIPPHWNENTTTASPSGAHWTHAIETVLRGEQNWTREEVDESPLAKAIWDYFKHMENCGHIRLLTDAEIAELNQPTTPEQDEAMRKWAEALQKAGVGKI